MFIVKLYDKELRHNIGSDNTLYIDLTTVKGAYNRVKRLNLKDYSYFEIYLKRETFYSNNNNQDQFIERVWL
jgi:hypothetical protein